MSNKELNINSKYQFALNEYTIIIEYLNIPNNTATALIKIYNKQNYYISLLGTLIMRENKEPSEMVSLNINFTHESHASE